MRLCILFVPFAALLIAADDADAIKKDKAELRGKWQVVRMEDWTGQKYPEAEIKKMRLGFADSKVTLFEGDQQHDYDYTIDPTKTPKLLEMVPTEGPHKGKAMKGYYKIEGDTLTICGGEPGEDRPKEFKPEKATKSAVLTLKRIKP